MTHAVLIGQSGQVASEFQDLALPDGWRLTSLGRADLDLCDPEVFASVINPLEPDVLINAAAYTAVDRAETEQDLARQVNAIAPGELARLAARRDIPLLHVSTDYVFDGSLDRPWTEDDRPRPLNAYGRTKLAGETAIFDSGVRAIILRTSWVFSPYGSNFVKTMLRVAETRDQLSIVSDQHGGPTPARDIARTLLELAARLTQAASAAPLGIYHYAGQPATSWAGFAEAIFDQADWLQARPSITPIPTSGYPTPAARPLNSVLDCTRLERDFGIKQPDWHIGLARTLNMLRDMT
jgi:dTDP-4-dehydrorhamnose reductase